MPAFASFNKAFCILYVVGIAFLATALADYTASHANLTMTPSVVPSTPTTLATVIREKMAGTATQAPAPYEPEASTAEQPAAVQRAIHEPAPELATVQPPSTTWRYDPNNSPRPTPRPCNELLDMAFASYRHTMGLCKKAASASPGEVKKMMPELKGYNFLPACKVPPPVGCCSDPYEMMNAERCFTWWPSAQKASYYEPPERLQGA